LEAILVQERSDIDDPIFKKSNTDMQEPHRRMLYIDSDDPKLKNVRTLTHEPMYIKLSKDVADPIRMSA
jgi:hypothetical protein